MKRSNSATLTLRSLPVIILILLFGCTNAVQAEKYLEFSPLHKRAYLLMVDGESITSELAKADKSGSTNGVTAWLGEYDDWLQCFANGGKAAYDLYLEKNADAMAVMHGMPRYSPWYYYCKAEMHLHASLMMLREGSIANAALRLREANSLLKECNKLYPEFLPAYKDSYMLQAAAGSLPNKYKTLAAVVGFKGKLNESMKSYADLIKKLKASKEFDCFHLRRLPFARN